MTKEEWTQVEQVLGRPYGSAQLVVDGFNVTLATQQVKPLKFSITPYVNGHFKGAWLIKDCEERRRFMRPVTTRLYSTKQRAAFKGVSKRALKAAGINLEKTGTYYRWEWSSFAPLKRHLIKHNVSIELVKNDRPEDFL